MNLQNRFRKWDAERDLIWWLIFMCRTLTVKHRKFWISSGWQKTSINVPLITGISATMPSQSCHTAEDLIKWQVRHNYSPAFYGLPQLFDVHHMVHEIICMFRDTSVIPREPLIVSQTNLLETANKKLIYGLMQSQP